VVNNISLNLINNRISIFVRNNIIDDILLNLVKGREAVGVETLVPTNLSFFYDSSYLFNAFFFLNVIFGAESDILGLHVGCL
jgi:hypothetical protein